MTSLVSADRVLNADNSFNTFDGKYFHNKTPTNTEEMMPRNAGELFLPGLKTEKIFLFVC
jgi:hypothetical protein